MTLDIDGVSNIDKFILDVTKDKSARFDLSPLTVKILDATSGVAVPSHCWQLEWTIHAHDDSFAKTCAALDGLELDSATVPQILRFDHNMAKICENGVYNFQINALEKMSGISINLDIKVYVNQGTLSFMTKDAEDPEFEAR